MEYIRNDLHSLPMDEHNWLLFGRGLELAVAATSKWLALWTKERTGRKKSCLIKKRNYVGVEQAKKRRSHNYIALQPTASTRFGSQRLLVVHWPKNWAHRWGISLEWKRYRWPWTVYRVKIEIFPQNWYQILRAARAGCRFIYIYMYI